MVRSAHLASGLRLPYVEQGEEAGVPVICLHAFADSWRSFERVLPHLPPSLHVFAVTQRGHGDADRPESGYAVEDFAVDAAEFMDAVGLEAAVLVASSSASLTVQRFAADHPERTLGVVFLGSPRSLADKPGASEFLDEVAALSDPIDPDYVGGFIDSLLAREVPAEFLEAMAAENLKVPAAVWKATVEGLMSAALPSGTIDAPALIIWGERDGIIPRSDQEALAAAFRESELVVYEGTGHVVHWEEPERVAADITRFALAVGDR